MADNNEELKDIIGGLVNSDDEELDINLDEQTKTLVEVGTDLSELLTNSVNMAEHFFEIFFDPDPHYVDLDMYDKEGTLRTYRVPNRAMDNRVAMSGEGAPEGMTEGYIGNLYVDEISKDLYIKKVDGGSIGWVNITPKPITVYTEEHTYNSELSTEITLHKIIAYPEHLQVYANGELLHPPLENVTLDMTTNHIFDYELGSDKKTLTIYKSLPLNCTIFVRYLDGLSGLKGDTAIKLSIGETKTLDAGNNANVTEELIDIGGEGNGQEIKLNFEIPRGDTGFSGVHVGSDEPTDEHQVVWLDTSANNASDADYAGMRIWDSGVSSSLKGYNKVYELKHSNFNKNSVILHGNLTMLDDGTVKGFIDRTNDNYVEIPYQIGNLAGKDWLVRGMCKTCKNTESPIIVFSKGWANFGNIKISQNRFLFSARTGNEEDYDSIHNNEGGKIILSIDDMTEVLKIYQYELYFQYDIGLYKLTIYDENGIELNHGYWTAPWKITKNGEIIDLHSQELIYISKAPTTTILIGASYMDTGYINYHPVGEEHYLQYFSLYVSNDEGKLENAFSTITTGTDTLTFPDGSIYSLPYYETITGGKVVDSIYKPVLDDYYRKTGKGNYYIINEKDKTFELPKPDIYSMICKLQQQIDELNKKV